MADKQNHGFGGFFYRFRIKHPDLPFWLSIIALISSVAMPILRRFLEGVP